MIPLTPMKELFMNEKTNFAILNGNTLKIIAAIAMTCDHVGLFFFPHIPLFRIIGRLAFPIFAFMIAEGVYYTKRKARYFLKIFSLAVLFQIVRFYFTGSLNMCVLVTFSLSILTLFALHRAKKSLWDDAISIMQKLLFAALFCAVVAVTYLLNLIFDIEYGFWGCMLPVFAGLFRLPEPTENRTQSLLETIPARALMMSIPMIPIVMNTTILQAYSFFALPLLFLYSGKRGKRKMKYFFYIFYPLHHAVLYVLQYFW